MNFFLIYQVKYFENSIDPIKIFIYLTKMIEILDYYPSLLMKTLIQLFRSYFEINRKQILNTKITEII